MTTATPITMPRTVNADRSLLVRMVSVANWRISPNWLLRTMELNHGDIESLDPLRHDSIARAQAAAKLPEGERLGFLTRSATIQSDRGSPLSTPGKCRRSV